MDTGLDNAFNLSNQDKMTIRFPCNEQGLYMLEKDAGQGKNTKRHTVMATVSSRNTHLER